MTKPIMHRFIKNYKKIQYNACIAITGAMHSTSKEKLYQELGLESLELDVGDEIPLFKTKQNFYKNSFFASTTIEWNNLDQDIRNSESYILFRPSILKFLGHLQIVFTALRILWV